MFVNNANNNNFARKILISISIVTFLFVQRLDATDESARLGTNSDPSGISSTAVGADIGRWCEATVLIADESGFGSGAIISPDGWILTNYHVVESSVQSAALYGNIAQAQVQRCELINGRVHPISDLESATVFDVDPAHDLALLRLVDKPSAALPFFHLADDASLGEACFAIGSQGGGIPWGIKRGNVAAVVRYPVHATDQVIERMFVPDAPPLAERLGFDRFDSTIVYTTCSISSGDSGGPLVNESGRLIGLTFATPTNYSMGSTGYHIAIEEIHEFLEDLPLEPRAVPFDVWTAGLPMAIRSSGPFLIDPMLQQRPVALEIAFADPEMAAHVASAVFVNLDDVSARQPANDEDVFPEGLWGSEDRGAFEFDLFIVNRFDGVAVVGYTNSNGLVDEIRIDHDNDNLTDVMWLLNDSGDWLPQIPRRRVDMISQIGDSRLMTKIIGGVLRQAYAPGDPINW